MLLNVFRGKNQRRANKCKKLIKKLWRELKIQKAQSNSIIRQSSADIAQLLLAGKHDEAFARAEHLYKDMCVEFVYHQVDQFSVRVYSHLHCVSKNCDLPTEVNKAMSSLVFASSMCEELHVLRLLQNLFRDRYGCEFVKTNVELLPGNLVDEEMKENICINSVSDDVKLRLMSAIADDYLIEPRPWERQITSECKEMARKNVIYHSSSYCDSPVSFSSESDDGSGSTSGFTSYSEVEFLEYQETSSIEITSNDRWEPRTWKRQFTKASDYKEMARKNELYHSSSYCDSPVSFSSESDDGSGSTSGFTSYSEVDFLEYQETSSIEITSNDRWERRTWKRQFTKASDYKEMARKNELYHSSSDCDSPMSFSSESEEFYSSDSTSDSTSSSEVDFLEYHERSSIEITSNDIWEPRSWKRQFTKASNYKEMARKNELYHYNSDCDSPVSFSSESEEFLHFSQYKWFH